MIGVLSPSDLAERLERGDPLVLLDVREPREVARGTLAGAVPIPLGDLARRASELDPARATVCICHHGVRSAQACAVLARAGFRELYNLSGGVDRWSLEVDPALPRY
jgi:rhodanese-related sulfurtransferase